MDLVAKSFRAYCQGCRAWILKQEPGQIQVWELAGGTQTVKQMLIKWEQIPDFSVGGKTNTFDYERRSCYQGCTHHLVGPITKSINDLIHWLKNPFGWGISGIQWNEIIPCGKKMQISCRSHSMKLWSHHQTDSRNEAICKWKSTLWSVQNSRNSILSTKCRVIIWNNPQQHIAPIHYHVE